MMKRVYICSPIGKNIKENLRKVRRYTKYALMCGTTPIVPHFFAECLDDNNPKEREIGLAAGLSLLWFCEEMWVFGNEITEGMANEIRFCENFKIPIRKIKEKQINRILGGNRK